MQLAQDKLEYTGVGDPIRKWREIPERYDAPEEEFNEFESEWNGQYNQGPIHKIKIITYWPYTDNGRDEIRTSRALKPFVAQVECDCGFFWNAKNQKDICEDTHNLHTKYPNGYDSSQSYGDVDERYFLALYPIGRKAL